MAETHVPQLKRNWRHLREVYKDTRTPEQITEHYLLERRLASKLLHAPAEERLNLYGPVYDELYARLPHHPRFTRRYDTSHAAKQVSILKRLVPSDARFMEIGAGDSSVSFAMTEVCRKVVAVDVTERAVLDRPRPANFQFVLSDGVSFPVESESMDFAYSHQLMEHLHPEDAETQLTEVARTLRSGGTYLCITPSRFTGPHDVSRYFEHKATAFHLKEYSYNELSHLFRAAGFHRIRACVMHGDQYAGAIPVWILVFVESLFKTLPITLRESLGTRRLVKAILGLSILADKA
jgi:SAM-dependent methyltransferase